MAKISNMVYSQISLHLLRMIATFLHFPMGHNHFGSKNKFLQKIMGGRKGG
jgi:hypothetical protein